MHQKEEPLSGLGEEESLLLFLFFYLMAMHTGLIKLLLATRLSPLRNLTCSELMTPREEWPTWIISLTDMSLTTECFGIEPSVPITCTLDSILRADFLFPFIREYCKALHSPPASLGKLLHHPCPWAPSCPAAGTPWSTQLCASGNRDGRITGILPHLTLGCWICDSAGQSTCTACANEVIHGCHYPGSHNQGFCPNDFWGPLLAVARSKNHDSDSI